MFSQLSFDMKIISKFASDDLQAQYKNTKLYIKQFALLILKTLIVLCSSILFFLTLFFILTPSSTKSDLRPLFEIKKSSQSSMITIFTNPSLKNNFCQNESILYYSTIYSKEQYCQFEHQNLPFEMINDYLIDVTLTGLDENVQFITSCMVKVNKQRSVCQKFGKSQKIRIFNNLNIKEIYAIEIELSLKVSSQPFGNVNVQFSQDIPFLIRLFKDNYFVISILSSVILALIMGFSFAMFQIPNILEKAREDDQKFKQS